MDSLLGLTSHSTSDISTTTIATATASMLTAPPHTAPVYTTTSTPPNTPADPLLLNMTPDMEALRKLSARCRSSSVSSASSSQVSCPDPSEPQNVDGLLSGRSTRSNSPFDRPQSGGCPYAFMTREDRKLDEQMKLKAILDHLDRKERERLDKEDRERFLENERKKKELYAAVERERREKKERERRQLEEEQIRLRKEAEEQYRRWQREKEDRLARDEKEDRLMQNEREDRATQKGTDDRLMQEDTKGNLVQKEKDEQTEHHPNRDCMSTKTSEEKSKDIAVEPESQNSGALSSFTDNLIDNIEDAMTTFAGEVFHLISKADIFYFVFSQIFRGASADWAEILMLGC